MILAWASLLETGSRTTHVGHMCLRQLASQALQAERSLVEGLQAPGSGTPDGGRASLGASPSLCTSESLSCPAPAYRTKGGSVGAIVIVSPRGAG